MAEQVIVVPAADIAAIEGGTTLAANTDHKLVDANPNRDSLIVSADVADVWVSYGSAAAVEHQGAVIRAGGDPLIEPSWKGEVHVISTGLAKIAYMEREFGTSSLSAEDDSFTPSGPSDDYFETAVATTPENLASVPGAAGSWRPVEGEAVEPEPVTRYATAMLSASGLALYLRLNEISGTIAADQLGAHDGTYKGTYTLGQPGLLASDADKAVKLGDDHYGYIEVAGYVPFVAGSKRTFVLLAESSDVLTSDDGSCALFTGNAGIHSPNLWFDTHTDLGFYPQNHLEAAWPAVWPGNHVPVLVVLTYDDEAQRAELFINGVSRGAKSTPQQYHANPGPLEIGTYSPGSINGFPGVIDEFAVCDGILSAEQILALYEATGNRRDHATDVDQSFSSATGGGYGIVADATYLYWADYDTDHIVRASLDGTGVNETWLATGDHAAGPAVTASHIYWAQTTGGIGRANIDGSGVNASFISAPAAPQQVVTDGTYLYWADATTKTIGRANLDGSDVNNAWIALAKFPGSIAVSGGHVYWTNPSEASIGRANIDGSNVMEDWLSGLGTAFNDPSGLVIHDGKIYFCTLFGAGDTIGRANIDGSDVNLYWATGGAGPDGIGADAAHVYWTNYNDGTIGRATFG